jgi:fumarate reductase flavoprotein subunit
MEKGVKQGIGVIIPVMTKLGNLKEEIQNAVAADSDAFKGETASRSSRRRSKSRGCAEEDVQGLQPLRGVRPRSRFLQVEPLDAPAHRGKLYAVKMYPFHFTSIGGIRVTGTWP